MLKKWRQRTSEPKTYIIYNSFKDLISVKWFYIFFSGQKTAKDLFNCMVKNVCEKVPKNGYGYPETHQTCPHSSSCPDSISLPGGQTCIKYGRRQGDLAKLLIPRKNALVKSKNICPICRVNNGDFGYRYILHPQISFLCQALSRYYAQACREGASSTAFLEVGWCS